ncbi:MAG: hypothetical protein JTT15_02220 [Candidatus Brockarchaeota archaeon]|nr:hypothetical protein [Candidatus Brockarchaeota archaeon]
MGKYIILFHNTSKSLKHTWERSICLVMLMDKLDFDNTVQHYLAKS